MRQPGEFPEIGFGTWRIAEQDAANKAILAAIEAGYRLFDTASSYENEAVIGEAIRNTGYSREKIWISGKVWNDDRGYEATLKAFSSTIKKLGVDYLDCYLIHWPASAAVHENAAQIDADTWKALEKLYMDGYVKMIGVCNYRIQHLERLGRTANVRPMVNQIEYHPGFGQPEVVEYCKKEGMIVEAWSPLGRGKLTKKKPVRELAETYQRTPAQICLRWLIQKGLVPLPKSVTPERIYSNYNIWDFEISEDDMKQMDEFPEMCSSGLDPDEITIFG